MPTTVTALAPTAVSSWALCAAFENRLILGLSDATQAKPKPLLGYTRWMTPADQDSSAAVQAEEGVHLLARDANVISMDGAGRLGKRASRIIEVWIVTSSTQDRTSDARIALQKHMTLEDLVMDSLDGWIPDGFATGQQAGFGITCKYVPGGDQVRRKAKIGPFVRVSVLLFELKYVLPLRARYATFP